MRGIAFGHLADQMADPTRQNSIERELKFAFGQFDDNDLIFVMPTIDAQRKKKKKKK